MSSRFVAALAVVLTVSSATAQDALPDLIDGIRTREFMPFFPEKLHGIARNRLEHVPETRVVFGHYFTPDGRTGVSASLSPLPAGGIAESIENNRIWASGGEITSVHSQPVSPGGHVIDCFTLRNDFMGINTCVAEIHGREVGLSVVDHVSPSLTALPDDIVREAHQVAGELVDALAAAP